MKLFKPDYYVKSFEHVQVKRLKKAGIRLLLCDIDNTLVAYDDKMPNQKVINFIHHMQSNGIEVALCSNSPKKRATRFSDSLSVSKTYAFSCKPFPHMFFVASRQHHIKRKEIALIGDQMYTDILGANLAGCYSILTAPIATKDRKVTKVFRFFEKLIYHHLEKTKQLIRGEFDD